jgi:hypothetical protein
MVAASRILTLIKPRFRVAPIPLQRARQYLRMRRLGYRAAEDCQQLRSVEWLLQDGDDFVRQLRRDGIARDDYHANA